MIIYGMPRSHSSLFLQSALRTDRLNEPFDRRTLFGADPRRAFFWPELYQRRKPTKMFQRLNQENTAVKFFGSSLYYCLEARSWFKDTEDSHTVYITQRSLQDQLLSHIIATEFGFSLREETASNPVEIPDSHFHILTLELDSFLRFFPKKGRIISLNNYPQEDFDLTQAQVKPQNTLARAEYITNLDRCREKIERLVEYYSKDYAKAFDNLKP